MTVVPHWRRRSLRSIVDEMKYLIFGLGAAAAVFAFLRGSRARRTSPQSDDPNVMLIG
jgi:hypothetical protein